MSSDITEIRHGISDSSSSSSSSSSSLSRPAPSRTFVPAPPAPQKTKSIPNIKKSRDSEPTPDRRADLFAKINSYLTSKRLAPYISDGIRAPSESASVEILEAIYKQILESIRSSYKRIMVDTFFEEGMGGMEACLVNFLHLDGAVGLAQAAIDQKEELFGLELEEIAIEMDASMVPGPKTRLGMKLIRFVNEFLKNPRISKTPNNSPDG